MRARKRRAILMAAAALLLAALACNAPGRPTLTPAPTAEQQAEVASPTPSQTAETTDTPVPDVTAEGECSLNAAWVADVTVPDDTQFEPGAAFVKTWRVRNTGSCDWETGAKLVFVSGDAMGAPSEVSVGPVAAGSSTDVSVNLTAPSSPGTYKGNWQMQAPDGIRFGSVIYVQIVVPAPATDTPEPTDTQEPTETPTEAATDTPGPPAVPPPLDVVWNILGGKTGSLGSPTDEAAEDRWVADQQFEQGYIYWRNNLGSPADYIYVLYYQGGTDPTEGTWERYEDTWTEGMAVYSCPEATPPKGPRRGFGKLWCNNLGVRNGLGDPTEEEVGRNAGFQDFEDGALLWTSRLHYIYAVFDDGTWRRFNETP